ncbi:MAG: glutamine synthetase, partial [Trebonia sp.]|nr:glutamine synthetase [Trebonia sp.]
DYTIDLVDALIKRGLEVEHYYPELGHGQQEIPIRHASALRAPKPLRSTAYLAVKRSELEHFRIHDVEHECRQRRLKF